MSLKTLSNLKLSGVSLTGNAVVGDVRSGKTFYNTDAKTKLTGTLSVGKATANGVATSAIVNGAWRVTVTGLTFTAGYVIIKRSGVVDGAVYNKDDTTSYFMLVMDSTGDDMVAMSADNYITSSGFQFQVPNSASYTWRAFEE